MASTFFFSDSPSVVTSTNTVINSASYNYRTSTLTRVELGNGVTSIGDDAFNACTNLTSIIIPSSVTNIGNSAFYVCENLTNITISKGVINIGTYAFNGCTSLTNITIPSSVTNINDYAFRLCSNLIRINFLGNPPTLATDIFTTANANLKIYRYSTKSGWTSTFGGKDVLLIDSSLKGLQTLGFLNISPGKISIKKTNLGRGKIKAIKNSILNSRFDADNDYPISNGSLYYDSNYNIGGAVQNEAEGGGQALLTNYYHNSPLLYIPDDYHTFANRTFHSINSPYNILPFNHDIQPRLLKMFGVGSKLGIASNSSNYLKTITNTTDFNPADGQSWVKYGVEQIVAIPPDAKKIKYGVKYLVKSDDFLRPNNFGGLSLYFQKDFTRSYVNISYVKNETFFTAISSLSTLYNVDSYTSFKADRGENAMCQWLGPNTSHVKVRRRNMINLANTIGGYPQYLNNFQILEDTIDIPTFSTSRESEDDNNGFPEYVSLQMFFAEWLGYFVESGPNPTSSGAIYFYEPFLYFI